MSEEDWGCSDKMSGVNLSQAEPMPGIFLGPDLEPNISPFPIQK